jgi:predicted metal-dependent hydrolase
MTTTRQMLDNARKRAEEEKQFEQRKTRYVIKLSRIDVFAAPHLRWVQHESHAQRFDTMTQAIGYAFTYLNLATDAFTIELV